MTTDEVSTRRAGTRLWVGWLGLGLTVLICAVLLTYFWGTGLRAHGWLIDGGSPEIPSEVIAELHPQPQHLGAGVIDPAAVEVAEPSDDQRIAQAAAAVPPDLPGRYGAAVANLDGGGLAHQQAATEAFIPASTMKVMTAVAVLDALGPQHRFVTQVVQTAPDQIVLVGGGDPLLASTDSSYHWAATIALPTTAELAARTAEALRNQGITRIRLGYDDSLFTGPVWHPDWPSADRTFVPPVSALVVDEAAGQPGTDSPSPAAARTFAEQLTAAGITVVGEPSAASGSGGRALALVSSAPLALLVQEMLVHSDNFVAEMLLRQIAVADGQPGSFDGGAAAMTARLTELGLWRDGHLIADGSGMSGKNRLTPAGLVAALQLAAEREELADVLAGMPVGCATGTLMNRFTAPGAEAGRGQVRAKTGSLDRISALAGYTPTADGGRLAFAFIGNDLPLDRDVRGWFDQVAARLASCDCVA